MIRIAAALLLTLVSLSLHAVTMEAEGRALIFDKDIDSARRAAIKNATQQASLQASAIVSSTQRIDQGVLSIDNMQVSTLGMVSNIEVLDEKIQGRMLWVKLRADIDFEAGCPAGVSGHGYQKSVAVTAFPLLYPQHASLGDLSNIQTELSHILSNQINQTSNLKALSAGMLNVHENTRNAPTRQLSAGALTTVLGYTRQLDVQYIVSGVIRDMTMYDSSVTDPKRNILVDFYNRMDYRSQRHLRTLALDLYIHDGFSGALLFSKQYTTAGRWNLAPEARPHFASAAFWQQDYGNQTQILIHQIADDLNDELRCMPFTARITKSEDNLLWFNAGALSGMKVGDKLTVYRKSNFFSDTMRSHVQLTNTRKTMTVIEVQPMFAIGRLAEDSSIDNIQADDVVIAW
ncbi:flagellar assembly protein T N-terminal domain-containing protein [Amphritea sp. 1_MG-2023]|uniref:flagellar assembly protein T N-terminal domain-containing protein n=1 Tax=Amphritea sp. 1_MG-2023 TaxID=3062670 RepID=UPI0026E18C43|nr:flagellar assembly protein T N-terminal domain-containing protein [Amphritea sp. 1_MG-2023]MDO6562597.1 flagellar assembly protein T N-terminal domain-containing protein [Amphritea sp. 1_MG-2023]